MKEVSGSLVHHVLTIKLSGHIDSVNAADVEKEITALREENPSQSVVLDCDALEYISSAGLRVLLGALQDMEGKGEMVVCNLTRSVRDVFILTGFNRLFNVE